MELRSHGKQQKNEKEEKKKENEENQTVQIKEEEIFNQTVKLEEKETNKDLNEKLNQKVTNPNNPKVIPKKNDEEKLNIQAFVRKLPSNEGEITLLKSFITNLSIYLKSKLEEISDNFYNNSLETEQLLNKMKLHLVNPSKRIQAQKLNDDMAKSKQNLLKDRENLMTFKDNVCSLIGDVEDERTFFHKETISSLNKFLKEQNTQIKFSNDQKEYIKKKEFDLQKEEENKKIHNEQNLNESEKEIQQNEKIEDNKIETNENITLQGQSNNSNGNTNNNISNHNYVIKSETPIIEVKSSNPTANTIIERTIPHKKVNFITQQVPHTKAKEENNQKNNQQNQGIGFNGPSKNYGINPPMFPQIPGLFPNQNQFNQNLRMPIQQQNFSLPPLMQFDPNLSQSVPNFMMNTGFQGNNDLNIDPSKFLLGLPSLQPPPLFDMNPLLMQAGIPTQNTNLNQGGNKNNPQNMMPQNLPGNNMNINLSNSLFTNPTLSTFNPFNFLMASMQLAQNQMPNMNNIPNINIHNNINQPNIGTKENIPNNIKQENKLPEIGITNTGNNTSNIPNLNALKDIKNDNVNQEKDKPKEEEKKEE
ncbi:MAG: hypothetical protein MJ252_04610 [archaeon]|nr:hypothetical protein [archaeon]